MLAGYITATTTDLARVVLHDGKPQLIGHRSFSNKDYVHFDSILSLYLRKNKADTQIACFGVAGPVINNTVTATNIPWKINGQQLKEEYALGKVTIVNDLVATAYGLFQLDEDQFFTLNKGRKIINGNIGLMAAGTGLGEALVFYDGGKYCPYASEGGHVDFSPTDQLEADLWEHLYANQGYVEAEDIISLGGLTQIYEFLVTFDRATKSDWYKRTKDKPAKIIEMALSGTDPIAERALDMFVNCYAAEAANLALKGMTLGGLYLGGLIAPQIITALEKGRFMERFVKKGKMGALLAKVPIHVIINDDTALLGAGAMALDLTNQ